MGQSGKGECIWKRADVDGKGRTYMKKGGHTGPPLWYFQITLQELFNS